MQMTMQSFRDHSAILPTNPPSYTQRKHSGNVFKEKSSTPDYTKIIQHRSKLDPASKISGHHVTQQLKIQQSHILPFRCARFL